MARNIFFTHKVVIVFILIGFSPFLFSQTLPNWVSNPTKDSPEYMYSVGAAPEYEQAKNNALASLAGKFNSRVAESFSSFYEEKLDGVEELTRVDTSVDVDDTDLNHFDYTRSELIHGQYWVEIQLNKSAFASDLIAKWNKIDQSLEKLVQLLPNTSSIEALLIGEDISTKIPQAAQLLSQLIVVQPSDDFNYRLGKYGVYLSDLRQMRSEMSVNLVNVSASNSVFAVIKEELGLRGVKVIAQKNEFKRNDASISVYEQSKVEKDDRGAFLNYLSVTLETKDQDNRNVANRVFHTRTRDYSESLLEAKTISILKNKLKKQSLSDVLGLEK